MTSFWARFRSPERREGAVPEQRAPTWEEVAAGRPEDPLAAFGRALEGVQGRFFRAPDWETAFRELADRIGGRSVALWRVPELEPLAPLLEAAGCPLLWPEDPAFRDRIARVDVGITTAQAGIVRTGTLLLPAGPGRPRSVSLLPELHVAFLPADRLVWTLGEALAQVAGSAVLVTGPSRTADIEQTLTLGAHGPREVWVWGVEAGEG